MTSAGPAVISQKVEAAKTEEIDAEIVDSPPGLPELENQVPKGLDLEAAERDSVKIPQPVEEVETAQIIVSLTTCPLKSICRLVGERASAVGAQSAENVFSDSEQRSESQF